MSFLGRVFGRKQGGTRVGNFIRQWAHENTYGILGQNVKDMSLQTRMNEINPNAGVSGRDLNTFEDS